MTELETTQKSSKPLAPALKKNDLRFTVRSGERNTDTVVQEQTYYFELNKENLPIKVGDGTYGVVFRVLDASDIRYAIKILYNASSTDLGQARSDIVKQRFEYEARAIEDVRNNLTKDDAFKDIPIIQPKGWTQKFHDSDAYKILTEHKIFEKFGLDVSQYAMVTKLYDGTLKDLLEGGAPKKNDTDSDKPSLSGYEILSTLDFATRFSTIKVFLNKIAEGLVALHKARKWHLDLKPANIYYICSENSFDVVIGDLGFIGQPQLAGTATSLDEIALGTRHYRSPEQKDFSDCCEVDVEYNNSSVQGVSSYRVIVTDPKFSDTIIEPGDALIFSKDKDRNEHLIEQIEWDKNKLKAVISFSTELPMKVDKNTQVVLYKHQSTRTDLFGFGALLYDMITCGRSPERFYDYLRVDDSTNKSISSIREKYRQVSTYSAQDPNYVNTFSTFRHKNGQDYAPLEIVELILECMLYQAKGTLFESEVDTNDLNLSTHWKAMDSALSKLNVLEKTYPSFWIKDQNPLFEPSVGESKGISGSPFQEELILLQNNDFSKLSYRLGHAAIRIRKLINLVQQETRDNEFFLAEMTPENINLDQEGSEKTGFSIITYQNFSEYQDDLLKDIVYTKVFYNSSNPYSHESLGHLRRVITLSPCSGKSVIDSDETGPKKEYKKNMWTYKFNNSSPFGDVVNKDDWIVFTSGELNQLHQVIDSNKDGIIKTKLIKGGSNALMKAGINEKKQVTVYYRNINAADYYLACLGTYLYQAFFVGLGGNSISAPPVIQRYKILYQNNPLQLKKAHSLLRKTLDKPVFKKEQNNIKMKMAVDLFCRIAALYTVLILPNPSRFFIDDNRSLTKTENIEQILDKLSGYWTRINSDVEKYLGLDSGYLSTPDNIVSLKKKKLNGFEAHEINDGFNIDKFCNEMLKGQEGGFINLYNRMTSS